MLCPMRYLVLRYDLKDKNWTVIIYKLLDCGLSIFVRCLVYRGQNAFFSFAFEFQRYCWTPQDLQVSQKVDILFKIRTATMWTVPFERWPLSYLQNLQTNTKTNR